MEWLCNVKSFLEKHLPPREYLRGRGSSQSWSSHSCPIWWKDERVGRAFLFFSQNYWISPQKISSEVIVFFFKQSTTFVHI